MEDAVPMEFDMALAVPRGRADIKAAVERALEQHKDEVKQILVDFGVPLVKCDDASSAAICPRMVHTTGRSRDRRPERGSDAKARAREWRN